MKKNREAAKQAVLELIKADLPVCGSAISRIYKVGHSFLADLVKQGVIIQTFDGKYRIRSTKPGEILLTKKFIYEFTAKELTEELKKRPEWAEIDIATDQQLVDELRKRGYDVKATKTILTSL